MADTQKLIDAVALILEEQEPPTEGALRDIVKAQAVVVQMTDHAGDDGPYLEAQIEDAVKTLEANFSIRMNVGHIFEAKDYRPWLTGRQGDIDWYYWERYRKHLLTTKRFSPHVVRPLDDITDKILDHLEDPRKEGGWSRRGLVVGHVQSGKTANYTGLICKAADAGYQVIIVLAGLLNSLRNQTQERIDSDFMGWCTRTSRGIGASRFGSKRRPVCLTTLTEDFNRNTANTQLQLRALNEPVVLVLKKNKHSLEQLHEWLFGQNEHDLRDFSMLMIDDEADHASVNTNKEDKDPTTINRAIRSLLKLFSRSSYVGYTATPFANIFINPGNEDEMTDGDLYKDLFPRDFILSLDPPDNYVGPHRIFSDEADLNTVRSIDDHEDCFPIKHKIDFVPNHLPPSIERAIDCFVIAKAIRLLRGQITMHNSMMINASRFTNVQNLLKGLVNERVKTLRRSVNNYGSLPTEEALKNSYLKSLYLTWKEEYSNLEFDWKKIQGKLKSSLDPVEVISVNSASTDTLDYSSEEYPNGRSVIAVGGLGLSRGLTLEGLLVSYFLRNSIMYDTLMQMGRWFGYRDGYEKICRIFMTDDAYNWYAHITEATEELRADFCAMEKAKLTPLQFGLRVRSHPAALIVTARNKMRTARDVPVRISLAGRLAETSVIYGGQSELNANKVTLEGVVKEASVEGTLDESCKCGFLWKGVSSRVVKDAVLSFQNHPECMLTYPEPLAAYIDWLADKGLDKFDILLSQLIKPENGSIKFSVAGYNINCPSRTVEDISESRIVFQKRRVASRGDERAGLTPDEIAYVKASYKGGNIPDKRYREVPGRLPLMMLNFVKIQEKKDKPFILVAPTYGLSFPCDPESDPRKEKTVQYRVNTVWWEKNFFMPGEEEEGD